MPGLPHRAGPRRLCRGGLTIPLPFGTLYTTNVTPDKDTGIGNYSDQDFLDALRRGKRRDDARLHPAMPYTSYTYMNELTSWRSKPIFSAFRPCGDGGRTTRLDFHSISVG